MIIRRCGFGLAVAAAVLVVPADPSCWLASSSASRGLDGAASAQTTPNYCGTCHPTERVAFETSVHAREFVTCDDCHGGDPTSRDVEDAHRSPFTGKPARKAIPELCASCHADIERMRPYNLPTDQLALYKLSRHGQRLAEGDEKVAVCSDCHDAHDIRSPANPQSPSHRRNIPATCGSCHDDEQLMADYGGTKHPYATYMTSVHAEQVFEHGNFNAPVCVDCHGVHGAAPPNYGDIHRVCGNCHTTTLTYMLEGPHGRQDREGRPECSSCHGHHAIQASLGKTLSASCVQCHTEDSDAFQVGERMEIMLQGASNEVQAADSLIADAARVPLDVEDHRARLEEARTYLTEVLPVSHAASVEPVEELTRRARSIATEVEHEMHGKLQDRNIRRFGLIAFWFYLLLTVAVLRQFRQRRPA